MTIPTVKLSNGLVVGNFSSPHAFVFEDGSNLSPCPPERARACMLHAVEVESPGIKGTVDIELSFKLTSSVRDELALAQALPGIDIILVPLPVMKAMADAGMPIGKCRTIRVADRVTKAIHINRFCKESCPEMRCGRRNCAIRVADRVTKAKENTKEKQHHELGTELSRAALARSGALGRGPQTYQAWLDLGKPHTKCDKCGDISNSCPEMRCGRRNCEECEGSGGYTRIPANAPEGSEGIWVECTECTPCDGIYRIQS
jgi:hypothetical protein